ncbi:MAG: polysaccharide biosynthesis/export family protein [Proteobacteria bacterium]|nr:polysaccharide biosynthesis/export family protein [Pseudomonadota bacterium]
MATTTVWLRGIALVLLASACGPVLQAPSPADKVSSEQATYLAQPYRIRAGDALEIKHRLAVELNDVAVVRPDGRISLPLIPSMVAAGQTSDELEAALRQAYARDLRNVELSVMVRSFATQRVFVGGEVEKPGMIDLVDGQTVMQAVYAAGGLRSTARTKEIVVVRHGEANQRLVFAVNLHDVVSGTDLAQDMRLLPLDTVIVPRSDIANLNLFVDQYIKGVLPATPSGTFLYNFNTSASSASGAVR